VTRALGALLLCAAAAMAQGPVYRERWADMHLERMRELVLRESRARDDATLQAVAGLVADGKDTPFQAAARALARLRGVAADDAFVLRACTGAFVLPEVVDPASSRADCHALHLSMQLPHVLPIPGEVEFEVAAFDGAGECVHRARFGKGAKLEDLRMAYTSHEVPAAELPDGRYRVRVALWLDGREPRATDPVLEYPFFVLRGYEQRVVALREHAASPGRELSPTARAVIVGMMLEVERAFQGEAFDGESDGVADLERAEHALANVIDGRPVLDGLHGAVPLGLPTGGADVLGAVVALPPADAAPRPLVVVAGMAPATSVDGARPLAPEARSARWVWRRDGDFGLRDDARVVWLQSPGGGLRYAQALPTAVAALHDLLRTDGRTVLVLELEAAVALCFSPDVLQQVASGVVLVGAGALAQPVLRRLGEVPVLGVPLSGHPSGAALRFTADVAGGKQGPVDWSCRFELAPDAPRPWVFGAAAARDRIAAFVRALPPKR